MHHHTTPLSLLALGLLANVTAFASTANLAAHTPDHLPVVAAAAGPRASAQVIDGLLTTYATDVELGVMGLVVRGTGARLQLHDAVYFESASTQIRLDDQVMLDFLASVLEEHPQTRFRVVGHTDPVPVRPGSPLVSNEALGLQRARIVGEALVARGVSPDRLSYGTMADAELVSVLSPAGYEADRRVEIWVDLGIPAEEVLRPERVAQR